MNTTKLKKFAQDARKKLLAQVAAKLEYVLTTDTAELRERAAQVRTIDRNARDPLSIQNARQPADGGFDFGKFGHGSAVTSFAAPAIRL